MMNTSEVSTNKLTRLNQLLHIHDNASIPAARFLLDEALSELKGKSYEGLVNLNQRVSACRLFVTVKEISCFIANVVNLVDSQKTPNLLIIATPNLEVNSEIFEVLKEEGGINESKLAYISSTDDNERIDEILGLVKSGKCNIVLADAYRLNSKLRIRNLGSAVEEIVYAMLFIVEPESMTTLQVVQAIETIEPSRVDLFPKDIMVLASVMNARECSALRSMKEPETPWEIDMVMDPLYKAVRENDINEISRMICLIQDQKDTSAAWGLIESVIKMILPILSYSM